MKLDRVDSNPAGGYRYVSVAVVESDRNGHWVMKQAPAGWHRVAIESEGYVPRVVGYITPEGEPKWFPFECGLSRKAPVEGRVTDDRGLPLPDVEVRFADVVCDPGGRYESTAEYRAKTDVTGHFRLDQLPKGRMSIWLNKTGFVRPGLGMAIRSPSTRVKLEMTLASSLRVRVDFAGAARPEQYLVHIAPEGGETVGSWGGSGQINAENEIVFENVPPGRYLIIGSPNPSSDSDRTDPLLVVLSGGSRADVTLLANPVKSSPGVEKSSE
jgi:hypothetical protein